MSLACLNVPKWAYWDLPRWLRILVAVVLAGYGAAVIAAAGTTPVRAATSGCSACSSGAWLPRWRQPGSSASRAAWCAICT